MSPVSEAPAPPQHQAGFSAQRLVRQATCEEVIRDGQKCQENWTDSVLVEGVADTGGQAKVVIQAGEVRVNGQLETRRGRQLVVGDRVEVAGKSYEVKGS